MSLFDRIVTQESGGVHLTPGGGLLTSPRGARGITQVMPATGTDPGFGVAPLRNQSRAEYLRFGNDYLNAMLTKYDGDEAKATAAYNWGPSKVDRAIQARGTNWLSLAPPETKQYVANTTGGTVADQDDKIGFNALAARFEGRQTNAGPQSLADVMAEMNAALPDLGKPPKGLALGVAPTGDQKAPGGPSGGLTAPERQRSKAQIFGRIATEAVGGLGGAALGTLAAPGAGTIAGAALGSGAGSLAAELFDPSESPLIQAGTSAAFGGLTQGVASALGSFLLPAVKRGGAELLTILRGTAPGLQPVPAQYFAGKGMQAVHNIGMSATFGGNALEEATALSRQAVREAAVDWQKQIAASITASTNLFDQVATAAKQGLATANVAKAAKEGTALLKTVPKESELGFIIGQLQGAYKGRLPFTVLKEDVKAGATMPGVTNVAPVGLQQIRTRLVSISLNSTNVDEVAVARQLIGSIDDAAEAALNSINPQLAGQWKQARALYKEGIQGKEIGTILGKVGIKDTVALSNNEGNNLLKALRDYRQPGAPGSSAGSTALTKTQLDNLETYAKALSAAEGGGSKSFTLISNGLQVNAVIRLASGVGIGTYGTTAENRPAQIGAAIILLGPTAIAKMLASPTVFRMMLAMSKMPASSRVGANLGAQLIGQMAREEMLPVQQQQSAQEAGQQGQ